MTPSSSTTWSMAILASCLLAGCDGVDFPGDQVDEFSLTSANGSEYTIHVARPHDYNDGSDDHEVLFVTDGDPDFSRTAQQADRYSKELLQPGTLVVGIMNYGNSGRTYDYTPTETSDLGGGGAGELLDFIVDDLIPRIESDYRVGTDRNDRGIMGHSYGGLFATYAMTRYNDHFKNYLALSPAYWWDDHAIFRFEEEARETNRFRKHLFYMAYGEMEALSIHLPSKAFFARLETHYEDARVVLHIVDGESHSSSRPESIREAMEFYYFGRNK